MNKTQFFGFCVFAIGVMLLIAVAFLAFTVPKSLLPLLWISSFVLIAFGVIIALASLIVERIKDLKSESKEEWKKRI